MGKLIQLLLFSTLLLPQFLFGEAGDEALSKYIEAEQASSKEEREALFNQALSLYLKVQEPSKELNYDIANCYYQLGEYGLAILYYYRALELDPRFYKAKENLAAAKRKIGLSSQESFSLPFSQVEMRLFYIGFIFCFFLFFALATLLSQRIFYRLAFLSLLIATACLGAVLYKQYLKPLEAVVIKPGPLRKDAGIQYTVVSTKNPIYGTKAHVLQITPDGAWLHIQTDDGETGYVSKEQARII